MKVKFSFIDKYGSSTSEDEQVIEMGADELIALFNVDKITYPYKMGESTGLKHAKIKETNFDLYRIDDRM